jgi:Leucine-rich repeat (LRR) protein
VVVVLLSLPAFTWADEASAMAALKKFNATFIHEGNNPKKPVRSLYLPSAKLTDADLKPVAELTQVQVLKLDGATKITDDGLKELVGLKKLQDLGLSSTQVTDAGLKQLAELKELQKLSLNSTKVTDAGLKQLKSIANLQQLGLNFTEVTDAGLKDLAACTKLELLAVSFTKVTADGAKGLQSALPKCKIIR